MVLIAFALYAGLLALINPPFEAPDEPNHLFYVNFVSKNCALPVLSANTSALPTEDGQPPLYYSVCALVVHALLYDDEVNDRFLLNSKAAFWGGTEAHTTFFDHQGLGFTSIGDGVVFYLLRLLTIAFSVGTLWVIWKILGLVFENFDVRMVGLIFAAALPQFAFISGTISNDAASVFFTTLALYWLLKVYREPDIGRNHLIAGAIFGIGFLVKMYEIVLAPGIVALYLILLIEKRTSLKRLAGRALLFCVAGIVFGSFPFVRAWILYGDPVMSDLLSSINAHTGDLGSPLSVSYWFLIARRTFVSFVATFGWMNYRLPIIGYLVHGVILGAAVVGSYLAARRQRISSQAVILAVVFLGNLLGVLYWNFRFGQAQGRYYFPSLPLFALFVALGLGEVSLRLRNRISYDSFYRTYVLSLTAVVILSLVWLYRFD